MKFTYRSGQRPLDGYTIKRGVGRGGFGEVYFAVSDAGKEVALKLLHRSPESELRGIGHCLNLKHPNLVHLYDLRTDDHGDKWLVMEYVFGEALAQWINRYPTGLPTELVKEWFAAIARGVGYLHEQGVVHRDIKPGNVFVENGHLKIGDYGLSRRISVSQGGEMTQGIGTPYYMAPEIGRGNYNQSVDIYALGVMLYEMLTGHPPFQGETANEVMFKHMTEAPDVTRVPAGFGPILERALDKNPATRYASVREFLRDIERLNSPTPEPLGVTVPPPPKPPTVRVEPAAPLGRPRAAPVGRVEEGGPKYASGPLPRSFRERLTQLTGSFVVVPLVAGMCVGGWALVESASWTLLGELLLLSTALSWAVLLVARPQQGRVDHTWGRRFQLLLVGFGIGAFAFWLEGWTLPRGESAADTSRDLVLGTWARVHPETFSTGMRYLFYFGLTAAACPWGSMTDRRRRRRFRLSRVILGGAAAGLLLFLWPWEVASPTLGVVPIVIAAISTQIASPWAPVVPSSHSRPARVDGARRPQRRDPV